MTDHTEPGQNDGQQIDQDTTAGVTPDGYRPLPDPDHEQATDLLPLWAAKLLQDDAISVTVEQSVQLYCTEREEIDADPEAAHETLRSALTGEAVELHPSVADVKVLE